MNLNYVDLKAGSESGNGASVADALARKLREAIVQGEISLGGSLPSERELMTKFKVSRTSVREALRVLGAQGLIQVRRGRHGGSFISSPPSHLVVQSLDLYIKGQDIRYIDLVNVREAIEPAAAAQAAIVQDEAKLKKLRQLCFDCEENLHDVPRFVQVNLDWHMAVAEASNNPLFVTFLLSISNAMHKATDLEEFDLKIRKAVVGVHWQIFEAIRKGDADAARRRMLRHLTAYGERLSSIGLLDDGSPAEAT